MDASSAFVAQGSVARWSVRPSRLQLTIALAVLALGVRCIGLNARPLWLDEAFSAWFASRSWHYLWTVVPTFEAHPPFYYSVLKLWSGLFGDSGVALRSLSVLFGVATVPVVAAAAFEQENLNPSGRPLLRAGFAAFLGACSPMLVFLGQEARPYPLLIFSYAVAILGLLRLTREFSEGRPGSWPSWAVLAVGTEVTLWAHGLGILYALCLALALAPAWLARPGSGERLRRGVAAGVTVALLYLPCLLMIAARARDWGANWVRWDPNELLRLITMYSVPQITTVASLVAAVAMLLLVKRAVQSACEARGCDQHRGMLLLWLGPPLLSALVSALFVPIFLTRTLAGTLVPAYLALASAIAHTSSPRERTVLTATICITLIPATVQTALRPSSERWDLVASYLSRNAGPNDQVWLYPADSALPLARTRVRLAAPVRAVPTPFPTLGFKGPIRAGWPAVVSVTRDQAARITGDPTLRRVPTVWLVTRQSPIFDPDGDMPRALSRVRKPDPAQEWGYIAVQPYRAAAGN
jgi:uncharacterized membrane protein